ncbi:hypothetical protein SCB49_01377 [unidentified eubacterium SCB49]|nr:hypothetical protein SCB49_01377 [unidentified eubacterium SCB49]
MKLIKAYIFQHFETLFTLFFATVSCMFLLAIRLKITQSFFLIFLVWNLFLAAIPYFISSFLTAKKTSRFVKNGLPLLWLLFLPNAPYIITDLIHLTHAQSYNKFFDAILIGFFALSGLLFYCVSLQQILAMFQQNWKPWKLVFLKWSIPFLCAFGIYLGRFLRWNSWDILQNPMGLLKDIITPFISPFEHPVAWLTTLSFGFGLYAVFFVFRKFQKQKT